MVEYFVLIVVSILVVLFINWWDDEPLEKIPVIRRHVPFPPRAVVVTPPVPLSRGKEQKIGIADLPINSPILSHLPAVVTNEEKDDDMAKKSLCRKCFWLDRGTCERGNLEAPKVYTCHMYTNKKGSEAAKLRREQASLEKQAQSASGDCGAAEFCDAGATTENTGTQRSTVILSHFV